MSNNKALFFYSYRSKRANPKSLLCSNRFLKKQRDKAKYNTLNKNPFMSNAFGMSPVSIKDLIPSNK